MGNLNKQFFLKSSPAQLWTIWKDVKNTPKWVEGVQASRLTGSHEEGVGLSWQEDCLFANFPAQMDHTISEWEPEKRTVVKTGLPMGGSMNRVTEFKSSEQGTEISVTLEWDLGMASAFVGEDKVREIMESNLEATIKKWDELASTS